jgi:tetratricopeptide (TPR) repeat protein
MGWIEILILMAMSGMFGGVLDVLQLIDIKKLIEQDARVLLSKRRFVGALLLGAVGGAGGAIAMLFVIVATAKLNTKPEPENRLMLISLGMVSGFLGYRVLRSVAQRVEKQIQEVETRAAKKIDESAARVEASTTQKIEETADRLQRETEYSKAITLGFMIAEKGDAIPSDTDTAISGLKRILEREPDNRQAGIVLSNIYRKLGGNNEALRVLSALTQSLEGKTARQKDLADSLYNRACLYNSMANQEKNELRIQELRNKAYEDLERSIRLSPINKDEALQDPDLESLRGDERFVRVTS